MTHLEEVRPVQEEEEWIWGKSCWAPSFPLALPEQPMWSTPPHHKVCNAYNYGECSRVWKRKYCNYLVLKQAFSSTVLSTISRILHVGMIQEVGENFGGKEQKWNDSLESSAKLQDYYEKIRKIIEILKVPSTIFLCCRLLFVAFKFPLNLCVIDLFNVDKKCILCSSSINSLIHFYSMFEQP